MEHAQPAPRPTRLWIALAILLAPGCRGLYGPVEPDRTVQALREDIHERVGNPVARLSLLAKLANVEDAMQQRGQRIAQMRQRLQELEKRVAVLEKFEVQRLEIHGLTGFSAAIGTDQSPALEVHIRTLDGYNHQTRVNGAFDFWLVEQTGRWFWRREKSLAHWTRRAHPDLRDAEQQVFDHYVFRLPRRPDLTMRPGLLLRVRLTSITGTVLETEYPLESDESSS